MFCHGQSKSRLKTSQQNVLENLYNIIEVMTEFIAVNTKKSTQLTKALVFNFFRNFLYFQLQESPHENKNQK